MAPAVYKGPRQLSGVFGGLKPEKTKKQRQFFAHDVCPGRVVMNSGEPLSKHPGSTADAYSVNVFGRTQHRGIV